jgi:hypothetical protein
VADAVDRERDDIHTADQSREQPAALVNTAVVVQKARGSAPRNGAKMADLVRPSADVEHRCAPEVERARLFPTIAE